MPFLTNNYNTLDLYEWLLTVENNVSLFSDKLSLEHVKVKMPFLIISYNYNFTLLPWNKGSHPNIWSFIENTPKGVTIHKIAKELDTGDILLQKEIYFDINEETLASSYNTLHHKMKQLFREKWHDIKFGLIKPYKQEGI